MNPILLDFPMPIITPRLFIRPPQSGDGAALNAAVIESFDHLHQFMDWAKEKPMLEASEEVVRLAAANWIAQKNEEPWLMLCIFDKNTHALIGATGFHHTVWEVPCMESGYWIRTSYAGQGLMTEAINAITQYAFKQLQVTRLAITCDRDNIRSRKIPERLGFQQEATLKANRRKPVSGELSDTIVYARYDLSQLPPLQVPGSSRLLLERFMTLIHTRPIASISHITLICQDLEKTARFLVQLLGALHIFSIIMS